MFQIEWVCMLSYVLNVLVCIMVEAYTCLLLNTLIELYRLQKATVNAICEVKFQVLLHAIIGTHFAIDFMHHELPPQNLQTYKLSIEVFINTIYGMAVNLWGAIGPGCSRWLFSSLLLINNTLIEVILDVQNVSVFIYKL